MICSECRSQGQESIVYPQGASKTLMYFQPWYDNTGVYHSHDGNTVTRYYRCSNSHQFVEIGKDPCPAGDWPVPARGNF